jgi:predicted TIM-barrel fold metal-dependent hydrolase
MIVSGVFDRVPKLKIVLGHAGEGIPFWLNRVDIRHAASAFNAHKLELKPSEYFHRNFVLTTSGMNWNPVLRFCVEIMGADNIVFAVDYPFEQTAPAIEGLLTAGLTEIDKHKIFSANAKRVFRIG